MAVRPRPLRRIKESNNACKYDKLGRPEAVIGGRQLWVRLQSHDIRVARAGGGELGESGFRKR
jgi:hypothetical protein